MKHALLVLTMVVLSAVSFAQKPEPLDALSGIALCAATGTLVSAMMLKENSNDTAKADIILKEAEWWLQLLNELDPDNGETLFGYYTGHLQTAYNEGTIEWELIANTSTQCSGMKAEILAEES